MQRLQLLRLQLLWLLQLLRLQLLWLLQLLRLLCCFACSWRRFVYPVSLCAVPCHFMSTVLGILMTSVSILQDLIFQDPYSGVQKNGFWIILFEIIFFQLLNMKSWIIFLLIKIILFRLIFQPFEGPQNRQCWNLIIFTLNNTTNVKYYQHQKRETDDKMISDVMKCSADVMKCALLHADHAGPSKREVGHKRSCLQTPAEVEYSKQQDLPLREGDEWNGKRKRITIF